ncbi:zinc finger BED domain-containing protein RICESLEEPER 1-like [Rosa chinensis]|uniref:zinc finger BED domain-containing protein RICESLEEPER 1-like n=1 Tax=Rosa chinensis TaxID=74649 RepID=UPI000D08F1FA|nr:zinc finger BED domain-containing protein RICESLEEPER 1-like [Rosa chinensis]
MASIPSIPSNSSTGSLGNEIIPAVQREEEVQSHNLATSKELKKVAAKRKREPAQKGLKKPPRSWVWEHFTKEEHPLMGIVDGKEQQVGHTTRAQCKYCPTHLACNSISNGTSSLIKHIEVLCKEYQCRNQLAGGQTQLVADGLDDSMVARHWTQEAGIQAATVMIVMDEMPFSAIERPGFRYFCKVTVPKFNVPCRKVIVKNFLKMYELKKEELKRELSSHCVCLTTDTWTLLQNINYMVLTAHFIDNGWKLHKRVINFCVIPNHQGITIGKILESCLRAWSIERVLTISVDNASANKHAIDYIRKKNEHLGKGDCFGSIRNAVRYVRSSSSRLDAFKACCEKEDCESKKICVLDVPTRWNSTYIMLETALGLKKAFDRLQDDEDVKYTSYFDEDEELVEEDGDEPDDFSVNLSQIRTRSSRKRVGLPNEADWAKAVVFTKFLKVFYEVTLRMAHKMRAKYKKYFGKLEDINQLLLVALVLDPRYKLRNVESMCKWMLNMEDSVVKQKSSELKDLVVTLTDLYAAANGPSGSQKTKSMSSSDVTQVGGSSHVSGKMADMLWD